MKYLKKFNEDIEELMRSRRLVHHETQPKLKQSKLMDEYLWLPVFCTRERGDTLDCGIFTDINLGGYGIGIRGDHFDEKSFNMAISKKGDSLGRKLYTVSDLEILIKDLGFDGMSKEEAVDAIIDKISDTRMGYCSADPELEKMNDVYVELDEIKDLLS